MSLNRKHHTISGLVVVVLGLDSIHTTGMDNTNKQNMAYKRIARSALSLAFEDLKGVKLQQSINEIVSFFRGDTLENFCLVAEFDYELVKKKAEAIIESRGIEYIPLQKNHY